MGKITYRYQCIRKRKRRNLKSLEKAREARLKNRLGINSEEPSAGLLQE